MDLIKQWELIQKKVSITTHQPGSIYNIFQINDKDGKDYLGNPITYIKPEPEQKKKSIN